NCDSDAVNSVLYEVSDRLRRMPRANLVVIPASEMTSNLVTEPKTAAARLGATHVLQTSVSCDGNIFNVSASLLDAKTLAFAKVGRLSGQYASNNLSTMSTALLGTVTSAFKIKPSKVHEEVDPAAYPYYAQGILLNRRDTHSAGQAIPLFERAIALDERSPLPYAGL